MGFLQDLYKDVKKSVDKEKRKCGICGCQETMTNLLLKYDNGEYMCDDCAFAYYKDKEDDFDTWLEKQPEGTFVQGGGIDTEK